MPPKKVNISYSVPLIPQFTTMSCWAAGVAMVVGFKNSASIDPKTIADELGYTKEYKSGLHPEDDKVFKKWGMKWESPMCYTVEGFASLLKKHGPLWLAAKVGAPHVRVVTGLKGDGTVDKTIVSINDPWPVGKGSKYIRTYRILAKAYEGLGAEELQTTTKPIYIAHA